MRAFAVRSLGEAAAIHDLPIRVRCAGVNLLDVAGIDFAGVAERVPTGERDLHTGDHIFGMAQTHGAYAEYTAVAPGVKTEPLARIPDGATDEQAAALSIPAITHRNFELVHRMRY